MATINYTIPQSILDLSNIDFKYKVIDVQGSLQMHEIPWITQSTASPIIPVSIQSNTGLADIYVKLLDNDKSYIVSKRIYINNGIQSLYPITIC